MTDDELTVAPARPLRFRSPELVTAIIGALEDAGEPVPWTAMIATFTGPRHTAKTIENTLNDLAKFGAVQRIGVYRDRWNDTRAVRATALGSAWFAGETIPFPTREDPDD